MKNKYFDETAMNVNSDAVIKDTVDTNMDKRVGEEDFMKNKYFDETAMNVNSDSVIKDTVDTNMDKRVGEEDFMKNKYFDETAMNVNSDAVIKDTVDTNMDKRVGEEDLMKLCRFCKSMLTSRCSRDGCAIDIPEDASFCYLCGGSIIYYCKICFTDSTDKDVTNDKPTQCDTIMNKKVGEEDYMKNKYFDETAMNVNSDAVIKDTVATNMDKRVGEEDFMKNKIL